jgi:hypothetical protein
MNTFKILLSSPNFFLCLFLVGAAIYDGIVSYQTYSIMDIVKSIGLVLISILYIVDILRSSKEKTSNTI